MAAEMTPAALKEAALRNGGYATPELNERLFLHFRGYAALAHLQPYTGLRALWLEGHGLRALDAGLSAQAQLRSLYVQENALETLDGLQGCVSARVVREKNRGGCCNACACAVLTRRCRHPPPLRYDAVPSHPQHRLHQRPSPPRGALTRGRTALVALPPNERWVADTTRTLRCAVELARQHAHSDEQLRGSLEGCRRQQ